MHKHYKLDTLINDLARPIYNFRMARAIVQQRTRTPNKPLIRSAKTRLRNARAEIDKIVREYVNSR